jgi:DcmR-like sensory protein
VVVSAAKIGLLRSALGGAADRVAFADMAEVGANPARIIPAWRDFVAAFDGGGYARGIGEPVWAERTPAELVECQRHETLLNLAFAGVPAWWLLCPYDTTTLGPEGLAEARGSHPFVSQGGAAALSAAYRGLDQAAGARCGSGGRRARWSARSATAAAGCGWPTSCATWSSCAPSPPGRWCGCTCTCADKAATPPGCGGVAGVACYWASIGRTLAAWGPLGPWATSNSTAWPSFSER